MRDKRNQGAFARVGTVAMASVYEATDEESWSERVKRELVPVVTGVVWKHE